MQFEYQGHTVNLLDTPGHEDFSEDTYRVLTAVDAAVMVIDAAKGVEAQTIKLLEVCRLRNTPIITFVNKMDREVREPFELLAEIEDVLKITCAPVTWPLGMGKAFRGVYHLLQHQVLTFTPGEERRTDGEIIKGLDNPELDKRFPMEVGQLREDVRPDRRRFAALRPRRLPRRQAEPRVLRLGYQQLRRTGDPAVADRLGAAAAGA